MGVIHMRKDGLGVKQLKSVLCGVKELIEILLHTPIHLGCYMQ
jgi:hypothetical protein